MSFVLLIGIIYKFVGFVFYVMFNWCYIIVVFILLGSMMNDYGYSMLLIYVVFLVILYIVKFNGEFCFCKKC